jgi:hypothetical protein
MRLRGESCAAAAEAHRYGTCKRVLAVDAAEAGGCAPADSTERLEETA